jgi:hypothetical protein
MAYLGSIGNTYEYNVVAFTLSPSVSVCVLRLCCHGTQTLTFEIRNGKKPRFPALNKGHDRPLWVCVFWIVA